MAKKIIPVKEITNRHPHTLRCNTDGDYAVFATRLLNETDEYRVALHMNEEEMTKLIAKLTLYFEDIVADCGIWAGFVRSMQKRYGKLLPFYDIDAENYDTTEPHVEDIQFLIWLTLTYQHPERIIYPGAPTITTMAKVAYSLMDKNLEEVPINETLKDFFCKAAFTADFYDMREVLKWYLFDCYLSSDCRKNLNICSSMAQMWTKQLQINIQQAFYLAECNAPYKLKTGPMALSAPEWLGQTLRANGREDAANHIESQKCLEFSAFLIQKADLKEGFQLISVENDVLNVTNNNMGNPNASEYDSKVVIGSFVNYAGEWFLNGDSYWSKHIEIYNNVKREHTSHVPITDKNVEAFLQKENGQRVLFFEDYHAYAEFLVNTLHFSQQNVDRLRLDIDAKNIAVFIGTKGQLMTMPNGALCIASKNNPFYDKATAQRDALTIAMTCPPEFAEYLINNGLLPAAALNTHEGTEEGIDIVQNNFDFLVKTCRPQDF